MFSCFSKKAVSPKITALTPVKTPLDDKIDDPFITKLIAANNEIIAEHDQKYPTPTIEQDKKLVNILMLSTLEFFGTVPWQTLTALGTQFKDAKDPNNFTVKDAWDQNSIQIFAAWVSVIIATGLIMAARPEYRNGIGRKVLWLSALSSMIRVPFWEAAQFGAQFAGELCGLSSRLASYLSTLVTGPLESLIQTPQLGAAAQFEKEAKEGTVQDPNLSWKDWFKKYYWDSWTTKDFLWNSLPDTLWQLGSQGSADILGYTQGNASLVKALISSSIVAGSVIGAAVLVDQRKNIAAASCYKTSVPSSYEDDCREDEEKASTKNISPKNPKK